MAKKSALSNTKSTFHIKPQPDIHSWSPTPKTEKEVLYLLKNAPLLFSNYRSLNKEWQQHFLDFCQGKKSLPLTYDPFFKKIFHPDIHPDRLSRLVSSILGINVKILHLLPNEDSMIDGSTLLIMDLLGELEDGSLINIEIQKQGYSFPAERISCYSADLVMRQYARVKGIKGSSFTYRDIKKVYVIIFFEKSSKIFHKIPHAYLHHGKTVFNTKLDMELLQEYFLIALDVFQKFPYPKNRNEQTAWFSLLVTENLEDAKNLLQEYREYPWIEEIYQEIAMLRCKPEEVLGMFSEALKILDQNTVKYMIDELQKELDEKSVLLEKKEVAIRKTAQEKETIINEKVSIINEKESIINEKNTALRAKDAEIEALRKQLENYQGR